MPIDVEMEIAPRGAAPRWIRFVARPSLLGNGDVAWDGVILDVELFDYLEQNADAILRRESQAVRHIVTRSCRLKADIVERDEREETGGVVGRGGKLLGIVDPAVPDDRVPAVLRRHRRAAP